MPVKVIQADISENVQPIPVDNRYSAYYILIRYQTQPVGWIWIDIDSNDAFISTERLQQAVRQQYGWHTILQSLGKELNITTNREYPTGGISVVVCTRNRPTYLTFCIEALIKLEYPEFEIVIIDNVPSNEDTYHLAAKYPVRYVREDRPGLDWARNRGIAEAKYDIVAFTDDDAQVDAWWLHAIGKAFRNEEVMCVTGYVAPSELETVTQEIFEFKYGGMGHGLRRKIINRKNLSDRQLMWASSFGIGANMAFRKSVFQKIGVFDIALDVGTPSRGAGDVEMFQRLVSNGYLLVYEPNMLIWHTHRRNIADLKSQIYSNGCGFGCYVITCFSRKNISRIAIIQFLLIDWFYKWNFRNLIKSPKKIPRSLTVAELKGMLKSPFAYRAAKKWAKQMIKANA